MGFYDHPAFQGLDKNFLLSLERKLNGLRGKSSNEVLATLMAISTEAQRYNVNLSPAQQQVLMQHLRSNLPANKRSQFDAIINLMMNNNKG